MVKRILVTTGLLLGLSLYAHAQEEPTSNYLLFRKGMWDFSYGADTLHLDTVFRFHSFLTLIGDTAQLEYFKRESKLDWVESSHGGLEFFLERTKDSVEKNYALKTGKIPAVIYYWPEPRVQRVTYSLNGDRIKLAGTLFNAGIILKDSVLNWAGLKSTTVDFVLIPCENPESLKPFKGSWMITGANGVRSTLNFYDRITKFKAEPFWKQQYGNIEYHDDFRILSLRWQGFMPREGGTIIESNSDVFILHRIEKNSYRVESFSYWIDRATKQYRDWGTMKKMKSPPTRSWTRRRQSLIGDWISEEALVINFGKDTLILNGNETTIKRIRQDTVVLDEQFAFSLSEKTLHITTTLEHKRDLSDEEWNLSRSGSYLVIRPRSEHAQRDDLDWSFGFHDDQLTMGVPGEYFGSYNQFFLLRMRKQ